MIVCESDGTLHSHLGGASQCPARRFRVDIDRRLRALQFHRGQCMFDCLLSLTALLGIQQSLRCHRLPGSDAMLRVAAWYLKLVSPDESLQLESAAAPQTRSPSLVLRSSLPLIRRASPPNVWPVLIR